MTSSARPHEMNSPATRLPIATMPGLNTASAAAGLRHSLIWFVGLAASGIALAVAFESDYLLPAKVSALAIFIVTFVGLFKLRLWAGSPLGRLMVLLYFMPFS